MKFAVALLALAAFAAAAPQPKKIFHDNFMDFLDLITEEVSDELAELTDQYIEFDEFRTSLDYLASANFRTLVHEMEDLPEFKAVVDYLETHSIDITFFIDTIDSIVDGIGTRRIRQSVSGKDLSSYIQDSIALFPKEKLAALYDEKIAEDADFKAAIEGIQSEEFQQLWEALFENSVFQVELQALSNNGIDVRDIVDEIVAIFGQNRA